EVPAVAVQVNLVSSPVQSVPTLAEGLKPGRSAVLQAVQLLYLLLSTKYASCAVAALRTSDSARPSKPRLRYSANCGMAIAARMPMIATTTRSSISVNPCDLLCFFLLTVPMLPPFSDSMTRVAVLTGDPVPGAFPGWEQARCHPPRVRMRHGDGEGAGLRSPEMLVSRFEGLSAGGAKAVTGGSKRHESNDP